MNALKILAPFVLAASSLFPSFAHAATVTTQVPAPMAAKSATKWGHEMRREEGRGGRWEERREEARREYRREGERPVYAPPVAPVYVPPVYAPAPVPVYAPAPMPVYAPPVTVVPRFDRDHGRPEYNRGAGYNYTVHHNVRW